MEKKRARDFRPGDVVKFKSQLTINGLPPVYSCLFLRDDTSIYNGIFLILSAPQHPHAALWGKPGTIVPIDLEYFDEVR